jgi:hypothetical protein
MGRAGIEPATLGLKVRLNKLQRTATNCNKRRRARTLIRTLNRCSLETTRPCLRAGPFAALWSGSSWLRSRTRRGPPPAGTWRGNNAQQDLPETFGANDQHDYAAQTRPFRVAVTGGGCMGLLRIRVRTFDSSRGHREKICKRALVGTARCTRGRWGQQRGQHDHRRPTVTRLSA